MNRKIIFAIAFSVMAAGSASAQKPTAKNGEASANTGGGAASIKVKQGTKFSYNTSSEMEMTQSAMGQEMTVTTRTTGLTELTAKKVAKQRIDWTLAIPELRMTMSNSMQPDAAMDTTIVTEPQNYVTSSNGKVLVAPKSANAGQMEMMMGGSMMKNFALWFTPALPKGAQSGESWEEQRRDTVNMNPGEEEDGGIKIISSQNLKYTYDGITDTLGVKVARIRWTATSMKIEGGGSIQGNNMTMEGDGAINGTSYYSTKDGLLFASVTNSESNMRLGINAGGQEMVIPMVQTTRVSVLRK
jgi:hypothetical protein